MESLGTLDALTLPNIKERLPTSSSADLHAPAPSPYLLPVGRKWETAKSRRKKKKQAKKRALAKQRSLKSQTQPMADLQSSIITPAELSKMSGSMGSNYDKNRRIANFDTTQADDQSFASSNDDSTIGDAHR